MQALKSELENALSGIIAQMDKAEELHKAELASMAANHSLGARNLLHYLILRSTDISELQRELSAKGLSALRFAEADARNNLLAVLEWLQQGQNQTRLNIDENLDALHANAQVLFNQNGPFPLPMVTLAAELLNQPKEIESLILAGMRVARINCGHDEADTWTALASETKKAADHLQLPCAVYFDLSGPKLRIKSIKNAKGTKVKSARLAVGDVIWLEESGALALAESKAWHMRSTIKGWIGKLSVGQMVYFDDGLVRAQVESVQPLKTRLRVVFAVGDSTKIKVQAGIQVPEAELDLPALTDSDLIDLQAVLPYADIMGLSFVHQAQDVAQMRGILEASGRNVGLVIKLETAPSIESLPELLFELMRYPRAGVMIARGDLGLALGFERLSEIQEEILWLCEAARLPVIWATQVLEKLVKTGLPSRAEITDAAMSVRAECVMLNKGAHQIEALNALLSIFHHMNGHMRKKRLLMRPLQLAKNYVNQHFEPKP